MTFYFPHLPCWSSLGLSTKYLNLGCARKAFLNLQGIY